MNLKNTFQAAVKAASATAAGLIPAKKMAPPTAPTPPPFTKKPGADPAAPEVLKAWRTSGLNPHLLVCYRPGTDPTNPNNLVSVTVRSNHNFIPHMRVLAQKVTPTTYNFVGPLPRWRGRM